MENSQTEAVLILGALGSGKTSFLKWLLNNRRQELGKMNLIVNDIGTENIDAGRLAKASELDVTALQSGCICCEDLAG
ncbi:GTP-binding protein, partial [Candidatus Peregrinibacteria bacterium]|nr:GTP-binding protein [Candidatus Peregrinibacteria bacterium]